MPRKTKREKIQSDIRKSFHVEIKPQGTQEQTTTVVSKNSFDTYQFEYSPGNRKKQTNLFTDTDTFSSIRKDLYKTVLLAIVALSAELLMYKYYN